MLKDLKIIVLIVLFLPLITPSIVNSSSPPSSQEDISIKTVEKPFCRDVTDITHSDGGIVYIGTSDDGLLKYNIDLDTYKVLNKSNSFPIDSISKLRWDNFNYILFFGRKSDVGDENLPWLYRYHKNESINHVDKITSEIKIIEIINESHILINSQNGYFIRNLGTEINAGIGYYYDGGYYPGPTYNENVIFDSLVYNNTLFDVGHSDMGFYYGRMSYIHRYNFKNGNLTKNVFTESHLNTCCIAYGSKNGELYVGSKKGIHIADPDDLNIIGNITTDDGLKSNNIMQLQYSHELDTIMAKTKKGLSIIKDDNIIINLNRSDGLLSNKINCIDWNENRSELYIGHDHGISILKIEDNTDIPTITTRQVTQATIGTNITINTTITDNSDLSSVKLLYRRKGETNFTTVQMKTSGEHYTANVPAIDETGTIEYYIQATDIYGNENRTEIYQVEVEESADDGVSPETIKIGISIAILLILITLGVLIYFVTTKDKKKS